MGALDGVINVKAPPGAYVAAVGSGLVDDAPALNAMLAGASAGARLMIPPGTYALGSRLQAPGGAQRIYFEGAGIGVTTLVPFGANTTFMYNGSPSGLTTGNYDFDFEAITFDGQRAINNGINVGNRDRSFKMRRCEFKNFKSVGVSADAHPHLQIEDCDFLNEDGVPSSGGIAILDGCYKTRVRNNRFDFLLYPMSVPGSARTYSTEFSGNDVDGHWWQLPSVVANSGGTVTYGAATIVDSSAPFAAYVSGYVSRSRTVRSMRVAVTGTSTYPFGFRITDALADFSGVQPGWIVRTADRWAVVQRVATITTSNDTVLISQWRELGANYGKITSRPTSGDAYTIYEIYHGKITGITSTTLTVDTAWSKFATGASVTPASGTLYELMVPHNDLKGVFLAAGAQKSNITRNNIENTQREGIFTYCSSAEIGENHVKFCQDHAITIASEASGGGGGGTAAVGNVVQGSGAAGIACYQDDSTLTANVTEGCNITQYAAGLGSIQIYAERVVASANRCVNNPEHGWVLPSALAQYGIRLTSSTDGKPAKDCLVVDTVASDFPSGAVRIESNASTGNEVRGTKGGLVSVDVTAPAPLVEHWGTGTPESSQIAAVSSVWHRTDGGAGTCLYVKESGSASTGWVAK